MYPEYDGKTGNVDEDGTCMNGPRIITEKNSRLEQRLLNGFRSRLDEKNKEVFDTFSIELKRAYLDSAIKYGVKKLTHTTGQ